MSDPLWRAYVTFRKKVEVLVEAPTYGDALRLLDRAAADMDVLDTVGSDYDRWEIAVPQVTTYVEEIAHNPYWAVWRQGEKGPVCEDLESRWAEIQEAAE